MDRSLDDIVSERHPVRGPRGGARRGGRRNDRNDYPRDGVRKSTREDSRDLDSEWVHDKYAENSSSRPYRGSRRLSPERERVYGSSRDNRDSRDNGPSAKLRVENIHYDLGKSDLDDLFNRIGPVSRLELLFDRAGRSEGVAYVTYESAHDAATAVREFDGANANGQPIHLFPVREGPSGGRRNPFDSAVAPPRSLEDRITIPRSRERSYSPYRPSNVSGPAPPNVDRYVPGERDSRSPRPRPRREGRPPGRRERGDRAERGRGGGREAAGRPERRPKKTQEELDAEMDDYWGASKANGGDAAAPSTAASADAPAPAALTQDVEMEL